MKKRILPLILLVILCFMLLQPAGANAQTVLDTDTPASLTLYYQKDGAAFAELQIRIYRVAQVFPGEIYQLIEPFASYPINIHNISTQAQWNHIAQTLHSYIVADQVAPDREGITDENGAVHFSDLETGLYFVQEAVAETSAGTYVFNRFMVYVPTPQPDGSHDYDVEAFPKCTNFVPNTQYSVTKLWQDGGERNARPKEVTVDIYKDGVLQDTQVLNAGNNWTYTWYVSVEDHGIWTVAERIVPEGYKVTIQQSGSAFSIINARQVLPDTPQTGDTFPLMQWVLIMCVSGVLLVILGIHSRRRK